MLGCCLAMAQDPANEQAWRLDIQQAKHDRSAATGSIVAGYVFVGGGVALMGIGLTQGKCLAFSGTNFTGTGPACYSHGTQTDWRFFAPGLGLTAAGAALAIVYTGRRTEAGERLKKLRSLGASQGWKVSLNGPSVIASYSW